MILFLLVLGAAKKLADRKLNELERLAYQVRAIDHDTAIVPKGQYYLTATGEILQNHAFKGKNLPHSHLVHIMSVAHVLMFVV